MGRNTILGWLCILAATTIFSTMEVVLKLPAVAESFHPMQITVERFLVGGVALLPLAALTLRRKGHRLTWGDVGALALTGFCCVPLGMVLYQMALTVGQANVVAVLFSGNPVFVVFLAFLLLREPIRWNNLAALGLEVLGILFILDLWGGQSVSIPSVALTILSALCFALYVVLGKKKTAVLGTLTVTCGSFLLGGGELLLLLLLSRTGPGGACCSALGLEIFRNVPFLVGITGANVGWFLCVCLVNTGAGYVFHMLAVEKTSATHGSLVFFFKPMLAPVFALLFLGEAITRPIALGILCFLAGSLVSILPNLFREKNRPRLTK